ncbi:MAG: DUF885 domain-containing protein [Parvularcula sp.]
MEKWAKRHHTALALVLSTSLLAAGCTKQGENPANEPPSPAKTETTGPVAPAAKTENQRFLAEMQRHATKVLRQSPLVATELGVSEDIAGPDYNARLPDYSFFARETAIALNDEFLADLRQFDRGALTGTAARTYDVMSAAYESAARRNQFSFGRGAVISSTSPYIISQLHGPHIDVPRTLLTQHPLNDAAGATAYVERLEAFDDALYSTEDALRLDAEAGVVPPSFALDGAAGSIRAFMDGPAAENILLTHLQDSLSDMADLTEEDRASLMARANTAMTDEIYPAFESLAETLLSLKKAAGTDAGIWRLEGGADFYQHALNSYGAGGKTADEIHALGLSEVARISDEMNKIMDDLGLPPGKTAGVRFAAMAQDPNQIYPDTDQSKEELLAVLREQVSEVEKRAPDWFGTLPTQDVEVRRIPVYEQDTAPGGYYTSPSLDGSRPGIYWINLKSTADWPKYTLKTLTFHEAVPGHHFQIALQQSIKDMPLIRNLLFFSEFGEGWALYAEEVAKEMGMYQDDPYGDLGRLQSELFRAARLVVDTGLHHKRWTREQAIDWMVEATGESRASVSREVERYAVWPGQATSYKLGMLKIEELRHRAEQELGDAFDIRAFHDAVLLEGSMPLPVLEKKINQWIEDQK